MQLKKWLALALALALILAASLAACGNSDKGDKSLADTSSGLTGESELEPDPEYPVSVGSYAVNARPGKVVSLAPAITEKICDLGFQNRLMGISKHCDYPESITGLPRYGTAQLPEVDAILDLAPHLVFSVAELPQDAMQSLNDAGISVVVLPSYSHSLEELEDTYLTISAIMEGRTTGKAMGERFVEELEARIDEIAAIPAGGDEPKNALYLRRLDFTIATGDTLEGELLERIGFVNVAAEQSNWVFDPEDANSTEGRAAFMSVDMIFCDERDVTIKMLEQSAFYKGLTAVLKDWYLYIDCAAFESQSLRMLEQLELMAGQK